MTFASVVFYAAGVWGIVVLTPLFFLFDVTGRQYAAPATYPQFYYGFLAVAMAWQLGFLVIGSNPARFRLMMIPSVVEKLGYVLILIVLYVSERIPLEDFLPAVPDFILCVLFAIAFVTTTVSARHAVGSNLSASH